MGKTISAVVADPNRLVGECICVAVRQRANVLALASTPEELLAALERHKPTIVVTDMEMPGLAIAQLLESLRRHAPHIALILVSDGLAGSQDVLKWGASAFVAKQHGAAVLVEAIDKVMEGFSFVAQAKPPARFDDLPAHDVCLSVRQRQVLRFLLYGLRAKQMAELLGIKTRTIENHKYQLMQIFNVHSSPELRKVVQRYGLGLWHDPA